MTSAARLPQIGDLLAEKYRVLRVVADGGMGVVFEAHHELLGKNVALKFPLPELAHLPGITERFLAEARLCARIENEHVVRVLDVSKLDGLPYIVMELVTGASLASELGAPWPSAKAAAFAVQVLEGLEAVHALGVVHRDVKPENVLVVATPRGPLLKLIDFGIAKDSIAQEVIGRLTRAGAMLGTPAYMAPEQIGDPLHAGPSVDLYSVGILLFEMLAGTSPFSGSTLEELTEQALTGRLRSLLAVVPSVPLELAAIFVRATALSATDRYASASDFKEALWPFAAGWAPGASTSSMPGARGTPAPPLVQTKTQLRTEYAEPPVGGDPPPAGATVLAEPPARGAPFTAPAAVLPANRMPSHVRVLASIAAGVIALSGLVAIALAVRSRRESDVGTAPPPFATLAPETDIAPLASESADPSAGGSVEKVPAKRGEPRPAPSIKVPPAETPTTVQVDSRRFRACNADDRASEVVVELRIAPNGSVRSASAVSSSASVPVTECVVTESRTLQFPPHERGDQVARMPVELTAPSSEPHERRRRPWLHGLPGFSRRQRPPADTE